MEFVYHDGEKLNKIFINNKCTYIDINNKMHNIIKVGLFTEQEGKFETEDYIIRFSKGILYLYDKQHNILGTYKFSKMYNKENSTFSTFNINMNHNSVLLSKYILKKDYYIELYKNNNINGNSDYYIIDNGDYYKIIDTYGIGSDTLYITENGYQLHISNGKFKRNSKWKGIPIGKI